MEPLDATVTVGWIAPMPVELTPAIAVLNDHREVLGDETLYHVGRIGPHWVAVVVLPRIGTHPAANAMANMHRSFPNIKHVLVVGIGGGMPQYGPEKQEIVLGDVVVSYPQGNDGGVAHYEFGAWQGEHELTARGHTLHPSDPLLAAVNNLRAKHMRRPGSAIPQILRDMRESLIEGERPQFDDPGGDRDYLFHDDYHHSDRHELCDGLCDFTQSIPRCDRGDNAKRIKDLPRIHYGTIGSSNTLILSSAKRNQLYRERRIICFEMEAAGVMSNYQALVIRGICDYADSHKNKWWQKYAAATAVACAKEALLLVPPERAPTPAQAAPQLPMNCLECLKSLAFPQMRNRFYDITPAATGTCGWLPRHSACKRWADSNSGLLWVKGKPGSGKSTLLKHTLGNLRTRPHDLVLSFFFDGRGGELQRTPLGLFRCLLYQVLRQIPDTLPELVSTFQNRHLEMGKPGVDWHWHREELWYYLETSLPKALETRSIWLFVDALDECGKEQALDLVKKLKSLIHAAKPVKSQFHVCFSCRHYPVLDPYCEFEISLEEENERDISVYVDDRLSQFYALTPSSIPRLIKGRASGVFMWARLMVERVLDLELEGAGLKRIEAAVYSAPPGLDQLYGDLMRNMGPASIKLMQWVCFATRPLSFDELRWAMSIEPDTPHRTLRAYENREDSVLDSTCNEEDMRRQVQTLSRGLAELTSSSPGELSQGLAKGPTSVVRFIHESVKDFFISILDASLMSENTAVSTAHLRLSRTCVRYLATEEVDRSTSEGYSDLPLLHYATMSWVTHTKECDSEGVPQDDLLELFSWPSNALVELWVHIYRTIATHTYVYPPRGSTLVHIIAFHGMIGALTAILQRTGHIAQDTPDRRRDPNWLPLSCGVGLPLMPSTDETVIDIEDEEGRTPLSYAITNGHEAVVKLLLATGSVKVNPKCKYGAPALLCAAENGYEAMVNLLLATGRAEVNSTDDALGRTPLIWAIENGHVAVVKMLLDKGGADINLGDSVWGRTPLSWAAGNGDEAMVKVLLATGRADVNARDSVFRRTPLLWAAEMGHEATVSLLLATKGVEISAEDLEVENEKGYTPLAQVIKDGRDDIVKMLFDTANVVTEQMDID